jgi:hypothetical protein
MQIAVEAVDIINISYSCSITRAHAQHYHRYLKTAVAGRDLSILSLDATKSLSLTVGEIVHGCLSDVEAVAGVVNSKDVYSLAVVGDTVAGTALH